MTAASRTSMHDGSFPQLTLDRGSPVPLYFQVAQHLERAIIDGAIEPGTIFQSEVHLADQLGLSRPTMRRAMQHLVDKGLVVRRRGVGTRVVQPKVRRQLELTSLYDDLAATGQEPATRLLSLTTVPAADALAERLGIAPGSPVVVIERLRLAKNRPIARMTNHLPGGLVELDEPALEQHSLYRLLRRTGIVLHAATQTVGARVATAEEAAMLDEPPGSAVLTMERTTYDDRGRAVEFATHLYAASRYSFEISLLAR